MRDEFGLWMAEIENDSLTRFFLHRVAAWASRFKQAPTALRRLMKRVPEEVYATRRAISGVCLAKAFSKWATVIGLPKKYPCPSLQYFVISPA